jgi:stage II sporulation protein D
MQLFLLIALVSVMVLPDFTTSYARENPEFLRIGLNYVLAAPSKVDITCDIDIAVWNFQGADTFYVLNNVKFISPSISNGVLSVKDINNEELTYEIDGAPKNISEMLLNGYSFVPSNYLEYLEADVKDFDSVINYNGKAYRGGISFFLNANNTFNIINKLSINEYTYGVINSEMGSSNPLEALKAQAVVARSYALTNLGRHEFSGYDLCDSTHCQVYKGYSGETVKTNQAVDDTKNLAVYYENIPVAAYFSKNSGGHTQNVEDVWNDKLGYLVGVDDPYSPVYNWNAKLTFSEIESKLRWAGYNIGTLESIAIKSRNSSGAVDTMQYTGNSGKAIITKEKIRSIIGTSLIKSTMFEINSEFETYTSIAARGVYIRGDSLSNLNKEKIYVLNASGETSELNKENAFVIDGNLTCKLFGTSSKDEVVTGNLINFNGMGSGHGVGLPQDSAIEMAKQGYDFKEILNYFYNDIEIK